MKKKTKEIIVETSCFECPFIQENECDDYWGMSFKTGKGQNKLGKMIMKIRKELKNG